MGVYFSISALLIIIVFMINYFSKKRVNSLETTLYKYLLILTSIGLVIDITTCILYKIGMDPNSLIYVLLSKWEFIYFVVWILLFGYYIKSLSIVDSNVKKKMENTAILFFIILWICMFFILALPIKYNVIGDVIVPQGIPLLFTYGTCMVLIVYSLYLSIRYRKNISSKKIKPLYIFVALMIVNFIIQRLFPEFFLINYLLSLVVVIMYFTIENPDLKLIAELNVARDSADKANKAKSEFLSSMSHEIRTPLNAIVGFSENLKDEELSPQMKEEVNDIIGASKTLLELVNGILDISKIESGKMEIINDEYNFKELFDELVALAKARLGDKDLEFMYYLDPSIPKVLYGDKTRIKQIILNILTNAIKYTNKGFFEFRVNSIINEDSIRLIISVEDTGIGIKKENIDKLFDKFTRFDEKNTTIEGTGLGLAITKRLVDLMNGNIIVQSKIGEGSKFTILIDQKIVAIPTKKEEEKILEINDFSNKKVLIVDDNTLNLKVAKRLLEKYNIECVCVTSGFECIDNIASGKKYDLILMDIMMPKLNGVDTYHRLKENEQFNIPVVCLTANAISGEREKYLKEGFNEYLAKPIDREELNRVLNKILKG